MGGGVRPERTHPTSTSTRGKTSTTQATSMTLSTAILALGTPENVMSSSRKRLTEHKPQKLTEFAYKPVERNSTSQDGADQAA